MIAVNGKMRVLLVNVDCKWNLALRRMHAYYEAMGAEVKTMDLGFGFYPHSRRATIDGSKYDMVAVSNIFEENAHRVDVINCDDVRYGGIGSRNPSAKLPQEIEDTPPKYYEGEDTAHGYLTRGCIRNCYFCKVPAHEGGLAPYRSVQEVVGDFKKAVFHDNNILAWGGAVDALGWLTEHGIRCRFDQGLDFRLLNEENLVALSRLNYMGEYIFALDDARYIGMFEKRMPMVKRHIQTPWRMKFYVYVNADMDPMETVERVEWLKRHECLPYIMRDRNIYGSEHEKFYTDIASWCNQPGLFKKMDFEEFLRRRNPKNISRQGTSSAIYRGEEPVSCESCWQPTLDLFFDDGNALCNQCYEAEAIASCAG